MSRQTGHHSQRRQSKAKSQQSQRSKQLTASPAFSRSKASTRPKNAGKARTTERSKVSRAKANKKSKKLKHSGHSGRSRHSKHSKNSRHSKRSKHSKHSKQPRFAESVVKMLSSSSDLNALELAKVKLPNLHVFQHEPEMKHVFNRFPIHVQAIAFLADYYARNLRLPAQQLQTQMPQLVIYLCTLLQSGSCSWQQVVSKLQRWFLIALEQPKQPKQPNQLAGGGLGWLKKVLVGIGLVSGASASGASVAQGPVNLTETLIDAKHKGFDSSDVLTPLNSALHGLRSVTHNNESMLSGAAFTYFDTLEDETASRTEQLFVTPFTTTVDKLIAYGLRLGYLDPSSHLNSKSQNLESDEISKLMYTFNDITSANFNAPLLSLSSHLSPIVSLYVDSVKNNMQAGLDSIQKFAVKKHLSQEQLETNMGQYNEDAVNFASSVAVVMQDFITTQTNAYIESNLNTGVTKQILTNLFGVPNSDAHVTSLVDAARNLRTSVFRLPILEHDRSSIRSRFRGMIEKLTGHFQRPRVVDEFKASLSQVVVMYEKYELFERNVSDFEPPFWTWSITLAAVSCLMALFGGSLWQIQRIDGSGNFEKANEDNSTSWRDKFEQVIQAADAKIAELQAALKNRMTGEPAVLSWSQPMELRSGRRL